MSGWSSPHQRSRFRAPTSPLTIDRRCSRRCRITFESTGITTKRRTGAALDLVVAGRLTIRDVTQPVTAPVHVEVADGQSIASGRFAIKQTAFGIKPISVGGVVAVKDTLDIAFSIAARP
ncbi:MAG: hypothetical protein DMF85_19025 [Acidobacteria bacterium]|nr:MAG: hypothetical protein DMF85_19025 [Acidobacteriota bacterium]